MKVRKKEVKDCEDSKGVKSKVLRLEYTHKGESGEILVKDYEEFMYNHILKQLRAKVRDAYTNFKTQKAHNKNRAKS